MVDLYPELKNKIKSDPTKKTLAIKEAEASHRERLQRVLSTPLSEFGFTPEEQVIQYRVESGFQSLVKQSESNSDRFLSTLENIGVVIVNSSQYLKYLRDLRIKTGRFDADLQKQVAAFVTHGDISRFFEKFGEKLPEAVKEELRQAIEGKNGVIFLGEHPHSLVKFHEGAHAIQHIQGWNSQTAGKAKTEVGVNIILIRAFNQNLLKAVTAGNYYVEDAMFTRPKVLPKSNDIYKELEDFERNITKSSMDYFEPLF